MVEPTGELSSNYLSPSVYLNSRVNLNDRKSLNESLEKADKNKRKTTQKEGKTDEISQNKQQDSCSVVRRVNNNFLRNDAKPQITARIIKPAAPQLVKAHALQ